MKENNLSSKKLERYAAVNNVCLMILSAAALTAFLVYTRVVLMPFVIAYFIYMLLNTAAAYMKEKWRIPTYLGLLGTVLLFVCFSVLSIFFISASIESFIQGADAYASTLNGTIDWCIATAQKMGIVLNSEILMNYFNNMQVFQMIKTMSVIKSCRRRALSFHAMPMKWMLTLPLKRDLKLQLHSKCFLMI